MARAGGTATPIEPGIVARVANAVRGAIRGALDAWFGPGQPLEPVAPESTRGRLLDYPFAFNRQTGKPRSEQGENAIDFPTLRALSDPTQGGFDLLRIAIEKRKDQMESQRWGIRSRDGKDGGDRARGIEKDLRFPDGEHTFAQWSRMLLDDLLVIDAPAIYLAPSTKGHRIPQVMDGGTLKRLSGEDGRTPMPPAPAFQQVLHGLPGVEYSLDEVICMPRNLRSYRFYGMSPVEQVLMTVNIGIRRATSQLEYYTAGSVPDSVANVPETWTPDHIRQFQEWWDSVFDGNTQERRRLRFIPFGVGIHPLLPEKLKDEFDEWLARIICFVFSLSPQALTKQMNRATAETSKQAAQEEGLEPLKNWLKGIVDLVLLKAYGVDDLEFVYQDEEIADPVDKATVTSLAVGKKAWMTQDEARKTYGLDPMTAEQQQELNPAPPPQLADGGDIGEPVAQEKRDAALVEGLSKVARALRPARAPAKLTVARNERGEVTALVAADK